MIPLIVDSFAGGGGASTGIEMALGRSPDIAINHNAAALAMHEANHPDTLHLSKNIWQVDPLEAVGNRPVGLAWFSPDCKHFSKAKGGKPVKRNVRDLAWTVVLWAKRARPAVIILENVEEFKDWGPLVESKPEVWTPCPERRGETFKRWIADLKRCGYKVEFRELVAADYGAPTTRRRFFMIARRDGKPIVWPRPTHGKPTDPDVIAGRKLPWRTAAEIIDWSLPCPSIFETSEEIMTKHGLRAVRPLADATMARVARGVKRYVLDAAKPFIVGVGGRMGQSPERGVDRPVQTMTTKADSSVVVPSLIRTDMHSAAARNGVYGPEEPIRTITATGSQQGVVAAHLTHLYTSNTSGGRGDVEQPIKTVTAGGGHAALVSAFMMKYYGTGVGQVVDDPFATVTTRDRFGLVTVTIEGTEYAIIDIGMRMLTPRELFSAQGFPPGYRIDDIAYDGRKLTKSEQISCVGNSVCPPLAAALVSANCADLAVEQVLEAAE